MMIIESVNLQEINEEIKKFCSISEPKILVLLGPTASGKTALSLEIAKKYNGEIISADSRQVYRHMDIGTDKISSENQQGISHNLLDIVSPSQRFTVADFKRLAEEKIEDILSRDALPMLVGGTGLYIRAVTENYAIPPSDEKLRAELYDELAQYQKEIGKESASKRMHEKLKKIDPSAASKIHHNNIPYIIRAIEIVLKTGKPKDEQRHKPKYKVLKIGLKWPREELTRRINERVDLQIKKGLIEETQKLLNMGYSRDLASMRSLGYREMSQFLSGELSKDQAISQLKINTRNFAKRQMTWFKKEADIIWASNL